MKNTPCQSAINALKAQWDSRINQLKTKDAELQAISIALKSLQALEINSTSLTNISDVNNIPSQTYSAKPYASISIRKAILYLLTEHVIEPKSSAQITKAIVDGGLVTKAVNFKAVVQTALGDMARERNEIEHTPEGYQITPAGREIWKGIKTSLDIKGN